MRFRSLTTKSLAAGLALAVGVPAVAMAAHPFDDVPDGQWFSEAVDWAFDNNLTTGKTPTTFNGWDTMNRYEGVVFFNRYDTEIVQPAVAGLEQKIDKVEQDIEDTVRMQFDMFDHDRQANSMTADTIAGSAVATTATVTVPDGYRGNIVIEFSAESVCYGILGWCEIDLLVDDDEITQINQAFDSTDGGSTSSQSWEGHTVRAVTAELGAGTYEVTVRAKVSFPNIDFIVDDGVLTAEVQLSDDDTLDVVEALP
jgi:hypothetical protein